ncbi:hypothetical protein LIA77_01706 [Sarocladium implicatum]|nr:hypothetical protein LIA77_01706 [Sarocladium implicatum]
MTTRYSISRQKACRQCADAKAKCDRRPGCCSRCQLRSLDCRYIVSRPSELTEGHEYTISGVEATPFTPTSDSPISRHDGARVSDYRSPFRNVHPAPVDHSSSSQRHSYRASTDIGGLNNRINLNFSELDLICPIDASDIQNRWLNSFVPLPGQSVKTYPVHVSNFIFRALKSYAAVAVRGRAIPPFIHPLHLSCQVGSNPLATCLSLVRVCHQPLPGSGGAAASILKHEMAQIHENTATYDELNMLLAFQAYFIYAMVLLFQLDHGADPFLRQAMMTLQELASACCQQGLVCVAEKDHARPKWEAWTVAEAKRRTLFAMYLFDSVLASQDGLPTYLGTELRGLPAPSARSLWRSTSRPAWEAEYNMVLVDWPASTLQIQELWPIPSEMDEAGVADLRERVDHWLEDADEFGMMLYAVTSCTHGG